MQGKKTSLKLKTTIAEQMANSFKKEPAKIIAQFRSDVAKLKQQQDKLKKEMNQANDLAKKAKAKYADLSLKLKTNASASLKKQSSAAKKNYLQSTQSLAKITSQTNALQKTIKMLVEKQNKFAFIAKELTKLEKQPIKKTEKPKIKKQPVTKMIKPTTFSPKVTPMTTTITPTEIRMPSTEESSADNNSFEKVTS